MPDPADLGDGLRVVSVGRDPRGRGWYVVIDKPPGMLSVPGKGAEKADCVAARLLAAVSGCTGPLVVHRLDMDTSGLMVFGLDEESQRRLSREFELRRVEKEYTALVEGVVPAQSGVFDAPMRLDVDRRPYQVVDPIQGKPARTAWKLLAIETDRSRLLLVPETGRTHQLRVHCAHAGHPILGDVLYGHESTAPRLMLHASRLAFQEPWPRAGGRRVEFISPPPF